MIACWDVLRPTLVTVTIVVMEVQVQTACHTQQGRDGTGRGGMSRIAHRTGHVQVRSREVMSCHIVVERGTQSKGLKGEWWMA